MKLRITLRIAIVLVISAVGIVVFWSSSDNTAPPISADLATMERSLAKVEQNKVVLQEGLKLVELKLGQNEKLAQSLTRTTNQLKDMEAYQSQHLQIATRIEQAPSPRHLLDPVMPVMAGRVVSSRNLPSWENVMSQYASATGTPTDTLESLFVEKN